MKQLTLLLAFGILMTGCGSTQYYNPRGVSSIHDRLDRYEQNAHTQSVYNTMNYNTNHGMGF